MTPFRLSMWDQPPAAKKSAPPAPVGQDQLSPFHRPAVAAGASPSSKVIPTQVVEKPVHAELESISDILKTVNPEAIPRPPVSDREAEFRRRGPPPMPSFGTQKSALSFEPVRKLSSLRR